MNCDDAKLDHMVYQVWEDGEITLQKGGELLWQRNLHCIAMGTEGLSLGKDALVHKSYGADWKTVEHSYIFARNRDEAFRASRLIQPDNLWVRVHFGALKEGK